MNKTIKIAIFTLILTFSASITFAQTADKWFNLGFESYQLKKYDQAIDSYTKCLEIDPKFADCYMGRGFAYNYLKKYQEAINDFSNFIELDPNNKDIYVAYQQRANAYLGLKQYEKANLDFSTVIKTHPDSELYFLRGISYFRTNNYFSAMEDFTKAIELNPKEGGYYLARSILHCNLEQHSLAKTDEQKVIQLGGKVPNPCTAKTNQNSGNSNQTGNSSATRQKTATEYFDSGKKLLDKKDFDGAIRDFTEAIRLKPQDSFYYSYRGEAYEGKNLLEKALADYSKAIELNKDYSLNYDRRSKVYRKLKRYNEALADLDNAIKFQDDKFPSSFYITDKIEIYREMKNHSAALKEINDLIAKSGKFSQYLLTRAKIKIDLNDKRGAIADYTEIIETYGNLATLMDVYLLKSSLHQQLGENAKAEQDMQSYQKINYLLTESKAADKAADAKDFTKAISIWTKLINENSTQSYLYYDRGSAYEKTNQMEKAMDDFRKSTRYATRISDKYYKAESHKKLAEYYYKKGNFQDALFEINESIKTGSVTIFSDDNRELRGNIYFALGEYQNAIKDYEEAKKGFGLFNILPSEAEKNLNTAYCKIGDSKCKK